MGRRAALGQLLQNVIGNSVKFARTDVDPVVHIGATGSEDGVTIRVADNGIGIEPAHRSLVFGVFARLHGDDRYPGRSEEHTSELQSLMRIPYAVFCLKN